MKKKILVIIICIFLIIFFIFNYKKFLNGNNNFKKSNEEIIENILNENLSYKAEMEVTVYSNKNENTYKIKQKETNDISTLEVLDSSDIKGLKLEYKNNKLILKNTELSLEKIFEEYTEFSNNYLFLKTFVKEYLEDEKVKITEEDGKIVVKIELKNPTKYIKYKELYINEKTGTPEKLVIKNSDKQIKVCIIYTNIEIFQ